MAELIQKKLQGEVEKYQQLQKGKRAEAVWSCPCPLSTMMRRRAPWGDLVCRELPLASVTPLSSSQPVFPRIVRFWAHLMFIIVFFHPRLE